MRAADERLADVTHGEHARGLDIVPILLRERIDTAREGKTTRNHPSSVTPPRNPTRARSRASHPSFSSSTSLDRAIIETTQNTQIFHPHLAHRDDDDDDDIASSPRVRRHRARARSKPYDDRPVASFAFPSRREDARRARTSYKHVRLLLAALLALGHSLILTDRHDDRQSRARERRTTSIADARRPVGFSVWCVRVSLYHSRMCLNTYYMSYYISHRDARVYYRVFDPVVWCMDRPCRYTHGGPPCAPSRSRPARARGPAHSRARGARDLDLDARTRRSFSVSLSRVRTRGIHAFRFVSCHFIRPRRRRSVAEWMRSDLSRAR